MEPTFSSLLFHTDTSQKGSAFGDPWKLTNFLTDKPDKINDNLPSKKNGGR